MGNKCAAVSRERYVKLSMRLFFLIFVLVLFTFSCSKDEESPAAEENINDFSFPLTAGATWVYVPFLHDDSIFDMELYINRVRGDTIIDQIKYKVIETEWSRINTYPESWYAGLDINSLLRRQNNLLILRSWNSDLWSWPVVIPENEVTLFNFDQDESGIETELGYFNRYCVSTEIPVIMMREVRNIRSFLGRYRLYQNVKLFQLTFMTHSDTIAVEKYWIADKIGIVRWSRSCENGVEYELRQVHK